MRAPYTLPVPGFDWLPAARSRHLKRGARLALDWPHPLAPWLAHACSGVRAPLAEILRRRPGDLLGALALPQVGAPLHGGDLAGALPPLLLELARRRALPEEGVWWPAPVSQLASAPLGAALRFDPPRVGMLFGPGWVELGKAETWDLSAPPVAPAFLPLARGGWLGLADTNPLAGIEAHPDKAGNTLSLGAASADAWVAELDAARDAIAAGLPDLAAEHAQVLATIVPVGTDAQVSWSASYQEAVGLVYLSLHPSRMTNAEALVHETQHNKLNLLTYTDAILENGDERYPSPVRPDPRPLWGVLLAVHAFVPVAALHRAWLAQGHALADPGRYRQVLAINHDGMEVVRAHARPTAVGRVLLEGLDEAERSLWATRPAEAAATG